MSHIQDDVAGRIRAELVCCDIYERVRLDALWIDQARGSAGSQGGQSGEPTNFGMQGAIGNAVVREDWHDLCYWGSPLPSLAMDWIRTMADLERYELSGSLLLCRTCWRPGTRHIVKNFSPLVPTLMDIVAEADEHEGAEHGPVFESPADSNIQAALRSAARLSALVAQVEHDLEHGEYYACYPAATAYRDGLVNGMGGAAGDLAGLLGPDVVRPLVQALCDIAKMGLEYSELVADHDRASREDFSCSAFGHLVEIAKAVSRQLPSQ